MNLDSVLYQLPGEKRILGSSEVPTGCAREGRTWRHVVLPLRRLVPVTTGRPAKAGCGRDGRDNRARGAGAVERALQRYADRNNLVLTVVLGVMTARLGMVFFGVAGMAVGAVGMVGMVGRLLVIA